MKMRKVAAVAALISFLGLGARAANATESGFYVGVNLGTASVEVDEETEDFFTTMPNAGIDDSTSTWSVAAGYRINPYVGTELSRVDLGEIDAYLNYLVLGSPGRADLYQRTEGTALAFIGAVPISNFEFNFRLGVLFAETEVESVNRNALSVEHEADDVSTEELLLGIGGAYEIADHFVVRADWVHYDDVGDEEVTSEGSIDTLTVGFAYRF
jgi:hypothetical protein